MKVLVLLGAPGSGKGTTAERIEKTSAYMQLSTGDLLREEIDANTKIGIEAKARIDRGELVSDEMIVGLVKAKLISDPEIDYLFDGFPRTVPQAEALDEMLKEFHSSVGLAILLELSEEAAIERITGRRTCRNCNAVFHIKYNKPKVDAVCDRCGGELYQRDDDQVETMRHRFEVYRNSTEKVVDYYRNKKKLVNINAERPIEEVFKDIKSHIA